MSKEFTFLTKLKKFQKDPNKKYLRIFRIYPSFAYQTLDTWLSKMSRRGWHVVDSNPISFLFEQGSLEERIYFTYQHGSGRRDSGEYSISLRYPSLEKTYGVKKKHSKLNNNEAKAYQTIEIDQKKIDIQYDIGYRELLSDRDRLYKKLAIRNFIIFCICIFVLIGVMLLNYFT